ncbi:hypothetical protein [Streptacidiphilus anmyonensis]|uniref:hypothetical protein n=1 Tax=Streptacidiphilus anmyonensis TaxID=405782 RepID=UPI0005A6E0C1|nr:hypothetical protein [Streptacidiphilus anmyonensis]
MLKLGKTRRSVALGAGALALAGVATIGLGGTANASVGAPNPATTDWFSLYLMNDSGGRYFEICSEQSSANTIHVAVQDDSAEGATVLLLNPWGGQNYGGYVSFNPGQCLTWTILGGSLGDKYNGSIQTPRVYNTGDVTYN